MKDSWNVDNPELQEIQSIIWAGFLPRNVVSAYQEGAAGRIYPGNARSVQAEGLCLFLGSPGQ
jgi:hypothetical protein